MKPAAFTYLRPASIDDALRQLAQLGPQAKVIAGGQSLGPMMNMRLARPEQLIDLNDLTELAYVRERAEWIEIGALTRHHEVAESALVRRHCPLLADAAQTIGHYAIRQRGTLGGSLAHADPAAQLPLVAVTLGARLNLMRRDSRRQVDAGGFFLSAMTTSLSSDELIESVCFPKAVTGDGFGFRMFNRRHGDYAIVAAAVAVTSQAGRVRAMRVGLGGAMPVPQRLLALEQSACGKVADGAWIAEVAAAAREAVRIEEDSRVSALYRRELTQALVSRALQEALDKTRE